MSDYISREAALTELQNPELFNVSPRFLQILRDLPAADVEPVRCWIPCSERPPEVGVEVLVYSRSSGMAVDYYDRGLFGYSDVTHWMPLPEPPEVVKENYCPNCGAKMDLEDDNGNQ